MPTAKQNPSNSELLPSEQMTPDCQNSPVYCEVLSSNPEPHTLTANSTSSPPPYIGKVFRGIDKCPQNSSLLHLRIIAVEGKKCGNVEDPECSNILFPNH